VRPSEMENLLRSKILGKVVLAFLRCRFVNDSEKFSFDVLCQSIRMPKAGCGEKIRRFHRFTVAIVLPPALL
jgi:hypothetical protein